VETGEPNWNPRNKKAKRDTEFVVPGVKEFVDANPKFIF
jgi:hypothetical protein